MPKVSIIVPVYNSKDYLRRCVDSIITQTFTDFELILVDDGSTDSSGSICDDYSTKDHRVKVFHKKNGGVSSARNLGLDKAKGEWITFVDSDDWLDQRFLSTILFDDINQVDLVISYAKCIGKCGEMPGPKYDSRFVNANEINTLFVKNDLAWQTSPWAKLFKREKCRCFRFVEGMNIGEDLVFLYKYIMECKAILILGVNYYNYDMTQANTLTRSIGNLDAELFAHNNVYETLDAVIAKYNIVENEIINKIDWIKSYYVHRVLNSLYWTPDISRKRRYDIIRSLDIDTYIQQTKFVSLKERLIRFFLKRRLYRVYDLIRVVKVYSYAKDFCYSTSL